MVDPLATELLVPVSIPGQGCFMFTRPLDWPEIPRGVPVPVFADEAGRLFLEMAPGRIELGFTYRQYPCGCARK